MHAHVLSYNPKSAITSHLTSIIFLIYGFMNKGIWSIWGKFGFGTEVGLRTGEGVDQHAPTNLELD